MDTSSAAGSVEMFGHEGELAAGCAECLRRFAPELRDNLMVEAGYDFLYFCFKAGRDFFHPHTRGVEVLVELAAEGLETAFRLGHGYLLP